jgi:hypothetical protein
VRLKIDPEKLQAADCFQGLSRWQLRKAVLMGQLRRFPAGAVAVRRADRDGTVVVALSGQTASNDGDVVTTAPSELLILDRFALERLRRRVS